MSWTKEKWAGNRGDRAQERGKGGFKLVGNWYFRVQKSLRVQTEARIQRSPERVAGRRMEGVDPFRRDFRSKTQL